MGMISIPKKKGFLFNNLLVLILKKQTKKNTIFTD